MLVFTNKHRFIIPSVKLTANVYYKQPQVYNTQDKFSVVLTNKKNRFIIHPNKHTASV